MAHQHVIDSDIRQTLVENHNLGRKTLKSIAGSNKKNFDTFIISSFAMCWHCPFTSVQSLRQLSLAFCPVYVDDGSMSRLISNSWQQELRAQPKLGQIHRHSWREVTLVLLRWPIELFKSQQRASLSPSCVRSCDVTRWSGRQTGVRLQCKATNLSDRN